MKIYTISILLLFSFLLSFKAYSFQNSGEFFKIYPIGKVKKKGDSTFIKILDRYSNALKGMDEFSHVIVVYWFNKNDTPEKRSILQVHPRGNKENPMTGVFACRSPARPNLIALAVCKIISVEKNVIYIDKIDAFDESPVIDLKPYIPRLDSHRKDIRLPQWLDLSPYKWLDTGKQEIDAKRP